MEIDKRTLAIWKGICENLYTDPGASHIYREECENCPHYDRIEWTGCDLDYCRIDFKPTRNWSVNK